MKLKEGWAERAINCGLFNSTHGICRALNDEAFVVLEKYLKFKLFPLS